MAQKFLVCVRKPFTYFFSDRNQRATFNVKVKRGQKEPEERKGSGREEERREKKRKKKKEIYIPCYF